MTVNYDEIILKMAKRLDFFHVPHSIHPCWGGSQLRFPWHKGDVAIHDDTSGSKFGLVETLGFPWDGDYVSTLTPTEATDNIIALYIEITAKSFNVVQQLKEVLADIKV